MSRLGVLEQLVLWNSDVPSAVDLVFLLVILVGLLARKEKQSRGAAEQTSWSDVTVARPIPQELNHLPEVRWVRWALARRGCVAFGVTCRSVSGPATNTILSLGPDLGDGRHLAGRPDRLGGHISLGQFAIVGAGRGGRREHRLPLGLDLFVALLVSGVTGGVLALLLGLPALRIRGLFLAVTTLAFAIALDSYFLNPTYFDAQDPPEHQPWRPVATLPAGDARDHVFRLPGLPGSVHARRPGGPPVPCRAGYCSGPGQPPGRRAASVPTTPVILSGFVFSGVLAGIAGALHVLVLHGARVGSYPPVQSLEIFSMAVIGGLVLRGRRAPRGVLPPGSGASRRPAYRLLVTGGGLLAVLLILPGGLGQAATRSVTLPAVVARRRESWCLAWWPTVAPNRARRTTIPRTRSTSWPERCGGDPDPPPARRSTSATGPSRSSSGWTSRWPRASSSPSSAPTARGSPPS